MSEIARSDRRTKRGTEHTAEASSGNLFADLGLPDADKLLAKADLAFAIQQIIQSRGLPQRAAARPIGVAHPDLSNLYRGRVEGFSIERLCRLLTALEQDVRIVVQPKPRSRRRANVRALVRAATAP
jgi:predicted XRE-type DNA-binding protein